ncbi:hypothetical protein HOL52_03760 [bacterium]|nr:hypothetical protein [bacterium]
MTNENKNSWYFNNSSDLSGTHLDLVYKKTELPGDILITEANKSIIVNEILEVLSEPNNKNTLSVFTSFLNSSVDFPAFLIDSLKYWALNNFNIRGCFNPFDLSSLEYVNNLFIDLYCPDDFEGGVYTAPQMVGDLYVKSYEHLICSGSKEEDWWDDVTEGFKSPITIEANEFNSGRFRNLNTVSCANKFVPLVHCYEVDSVLLGRKGNSNNFNDKFHSLSFQYEGNNSDSIDLYYVNNVVLDGVFSQGLKNVTYKLTVDFTDFNEFPSS